MCKCINMLAEEGLASWKPVTDISANLTLIQNKPGVYVLRVFGKGHQYSDELQQNYIAEVTQLHEHKKRLFSKFGLIWTPDSDRTFIERRLERLSRIKDGSEGSCRIIYIGSSNNLRQRLEQLLCKEDRHTIEHPVRALLLNGWLIECTWKVTPKYLEEEKQLKIVFKMEHSGALPPLVNR